jgi:hypothetical protein
MNNINFLTDIDSNPLFLVIAPDEEVAGILLSLAAKLAVNGPVEVLDGGNCFNAYQVAREIRRQSPHLKIALDRIRISRAFTCYQMLALLEREPASRAPKLALDLLATFYDENLPVAESSRLLQICIGHLKRLNQAAPVVVSARPPGVDQADRLTLVEQLQEITENVLVLNRPQIPPPLRLF